MLRLFEPLRRIRALLPALFVALVLIAPRASEASAITWLYQSTVTSTYNASLFPLGTPGTIVVTVDTAPNLQAGSPFNGGAYDYDARIDFFGREFEITGIFEFNYDPAHLFPHPGETYEILFGVSGSPAFLQCTLCAAPGLLLPANPASPDFAIFPVLPFTIGLPDDGSGFVTFTGANPQVVPEPGALTLLGLGLTYVGSRVWRLRR